MTSTMVLTNQMPFFPELCGFRGKDNLINYFSGHPGIFIDFIKNISAKNFLICIVTKNWRHINVHYMKKSQTEWTMSQRN